MSRFDFISFDDVSKTKQAAIKAKFLELEAVLNEQLPSTPGGRDPFGREKALVLTDLESAYARVGRAVRDEQIARVGTATLQEGRTNS